MSETTTVDTGRAEGGNRLELIAAIILGLAATLAAFAAYQGALADGNSLEAYTLSTQNLSDSNQFYSQSFQQYNYDQSLFTEYALLNFSEDPADADAAAYIYNSLMDDNLRGAIDWWVEDEAAETPFDADSPYASEDAVAAEETLLASQEGFAEGAEANEVGDRFELAGVILAITLFFAGIATLLSSRKVVAAVLAMATVTFLVGAGMVADAYSAI